MSPLAERNDDVTRDTGSYHKPFEYQQNSINQDLI